MATRRPYTLSARHALPALAAAGVLGVGALAWPFTVDDAFIVARYAQNLVAGHGYGMNPGAPSDGVTGPLWLAVEVIALGMTLDPLRSAKALGLACTAVACSLTVRELQKRALGSRASCAATITIVLVPSLGTWGVSGLETGLATLLVVLGARASLRRPRVQPVTLGVCMGALGWLRPELALLAGVLLGAAIARERRAGLLALVPAVVAALLLLIFRYTLFGDVLPLSLRAKPGTLQDGLSYVLLSGVLATSLGGTALAALGAHLGRRDDHVLGWAVLAHVLAIILAGGDWMPGYRLLVPVLPLYAALLGVGFARLRRRAPSVAILLLVLSCVVPAIDLVTRIAELREGARIGASTNELAGWLRARAKVVALVDVGRIGYVSGVRVLDLGGLTDPAIARLPGGHLTKRVGERELRAAGVDALVLHSVARPEVDAEGRLRALASFPVEERVAKLRYVREHFRVARVHRHHSNYYYAVLLKSDRGR